MPRRRLIEAALAALAVCWHAPQAGAVDAQRFAALRALGAVAAAAANNDPVGLRTLLAFDGPDLQGADGPMARAGIDLTLLYYEYEDYATRGRPGPFVTSVVGLALDGERVLVDVVAEDDASATLLPLLELLGLGGAAARGRLLSGWLPIVSLDVASRLPGLLSLRPVYAYVHAGVITSQGDTALAAALGRASHDVDGGGITVGVLSDSFDCTGGYVTDVGTGDLPPGIAVLEEVASCAGRTDEGRAMLQIVHDLAPGAALAFHTAFNGTASFAQGIADLASAGADVIVDDVGVFSQPMFQDGVIAQTVDLAVAQGSAYFSSAGNSARQSYESTFRLTGVAGARGLRHDFDPSASQDTLQAVRLPANGTVLIFLQWDQPFYSVSGSPGATGDLELVLYVGGPFYFYSGALNVGGDAFDALGITNSGPETTVQLAIELRSGTAPGRVKYIHLGGLVLDEFVTSSSTVFGHANAAGARAVGAAYYGTTPAYGTTPPALDSYSSRGGTTIRVDPAGMPTFEARQKPEIVAADGVDTTFFSTSDPDFTGYPNFFGTSAAAPHAAAIAALLRDLDPSAAPTDVYAALLESALDMNAAGYDEDSGAGLVQADRALAHFAANSGDGVLLGFGASPAGGTLASPFPGDLFAAQGLLIDDSDSLAQASTTALPGGGPQGTLSGPFLLVPATAGGTWVELEFVPLGGDIAFDFATPAGQIELLGTDATGALVFSGGAVGSVPFQGPDATTWLSGTATLPSALALRTLRVAPATGSDPLAIDNLRFTRILAGPPAQADVPIPVPALLATALLISAAGWRRARRLPRRSDGP
jgi:hypothetical protein